MHESIIAAHGLIKVADYLFTKSLDGMTDELALRRVSPDANPFIWIAGHITSSRYAFSRYFGDEVAFSHRDLFKRGSSFDESATYPTLAEIKNDWDNITQILLLRIENLNADAFSQAIPIEFPHQDNTLRGALYFMCYHESHHIGQLSYIRKFFNLEGLVR